MTDHVWEVVGGGSKGGVVVRVDESTTSEELPERLATGSMVRELALEGSRLKFERLSGSGPDTGWVSTVFRSSELLVRTTETPSDTNSSSSMFASALVADAKDADTLLPVSLEEIDFSNLLFCVLGGSGKGGILVRQGADTSSTQVTERLATGSIVKAVETVGDRIRYELVEGTGPSAGWVSLKLKGQPLLSALWVRSLQISELANRPSDEILPIRDRKLRILAIHGAPANHDFMKFQIAQLRFKLGKDVADWIIPTGLFPWQPLHVNTSPEFETYTRERTDFEKRLAKGKPFTMWIPLNYNNGLFQTDWTGLRQSRDHIKQMLQDEAPIDVVVTFSQASILVCYIMDMLREEGKPIPWRLNIFVGAPGTDPSSPLREPFTTPTIFAWGDRDPWGQYRHTWNKVFTDRTILEYDDAHEFPITEPRASELYSHIVQDIRRWCGLSSSDQS